MKKSHISILYKKKLFGLYVFILVLCFITPVFAAEAIYSSSNLNFIPTSQMVDTINAKKIHFSHASVGANIMDGFNIAPLKIGSKTVQLTEFSISQWNGDAKQKVAQWKKEILSLTTPYDILVFKWCFVDDVDAVAVNNLVAAINSIRTSSNNNVKNAKILILTQPLGSGWQDSGGWMSLNDFIITANNLIKQINLVNVWIYDIADVESTRDNGSTCTDINGLRYLCPEYTTDNGHPDTAVGTKRVAKGFFYALHAVATYNAQPTTTVTPPSLIGDFNKDCKVSALDLSMFLTRYRSTNPADLSVYDISGDQIIGMSDLSIFLYHYGAVC